MGVMIKASSIARPDTPVRHPNGDLRVALGDIDPRGAFMHQIHGPLLPPRGSGDRTGRPTRGGESPAQASLEA